MYHHHLSICLCISFIECIYANLPVDFFPQFETKQKKNNKQMEMEKPNEWGPDFGDINTLSFELFNQIEFAHSAINTGFFD